VKDPVHSAAVTSTQHGSAARTHGAPQRQQPGGWAAPTTPAAGSTAQTSRATATRHRRRGRRHRRRRSLPPRRSRPGGRRPAARHLGERQPDDLGRGASTSWSAVSFPVRSLQGGQAGEGPRCVSTCALAPPPPAPRRRVRFLTLLGTILDRDALLRWGSVKKEARRMSAEPDSSTSRCVT
jgi:hypothetical protein